MSEVTYRLVPEIKTPSTSRIEVKETLSFDMFEGINDTFVSQYIIECRTIEYGERDLYYIYIDTCEEIDKLDAGIDHEITMSFYPILQIYDLNEGMITIDNLSPYSPWPQIQPITVLKSELREQLLKVKMEIEAMVSAQIGSR